MAHFGARGQTELGLMTKRAFLRAYPNLSKQCFPKGGDFRDHRGLVCGQNFQPNFLVFFFQRVYFVILRYTNKEFLSIINF
jgi:hypothetical protein